MTSLTESLLVYLPLNTQHGSPQGCICRAVWERWDRIELFVLRRQLLSP